MGDQDEAAQQIQDELHRREVGEIIEIGHSHFGTAQFDEASNAVATELGPQTQELMAMLRAFDRPHELLVHLATNEGRLKALAKMQPAQQAVELARIEAQMTSNGRGSTGPGPLWKSPTVRGRVSDADWKTSYGEGMSDRQWFAEFDRRQAARPRR